MKDITEKNFGPLIAFCLPGFILLVLLSLSFPRIQELASTYSTKDGLSVGGFLYSTLASLSLGLLLSAVRSAIVDLLICSEYGLRDQELPTIDASRLVNPDVYAAFLGANENHYRYYQYYSNSLVAIVIGFSTYVWEKGCSGFVWFLFLVTIIFLGIASRDCYRTFRVRASAITSQEGAGNEQRLGTQKSKKRGKEGEEGEEGSEEDGEEGEKSG